MVATELPIKAWTRKCYDNFKNHSNARLDTETNPIIIKNKQWDHWHCIYRM